MAEPAENQKQTLERPEYVPEKFWNAETGEVRLEDAFKSYTSLEQKMSGKKQAPESYALEFDESIDKSIIEDLTAEDKVISSMMAIAKEADLPQAAFNKLVGVLVNAEIEGMSEIEKSRAAELQALGEHGERRVKDLSQWLDANLEEDLAKGLKASLKTAAGVKALETLKEKFKTPSLKQGEDFQQDTVQLHEELRTRFLAKDQNGNRLMRNKDYAEQWRKDAAAANFTA